MRLFKDDNFYFLKSVFKLDRDLLCTFTIYTFFDIISSEIKDSHIDIKNFLINDHCFKQRGEILIKCNAYDAPEGFKKISIKIGPLQKELYVFGDRYWIKRSGSWAKTTPKPFKEIEISWQNAFGGPGYDKNPLGKGFVPVKKEKEEEIWPLPNIEDPRQLITSPKDCPEPACFLPYEPTWPQRSSYLGTYDEKWLKEHWPWFPEDFNLLFFNAAPIDQQIEGYFQGGEEIWIENMHPERPLIRTRLPGIRSRCFVNQKKQGALEFKEVALNLDTICLVPHEEIGIIFWHGALSVQNEEVDDIEHILVVSEKMDRAPRPLEYYYDILLTKLKEETEKIEEEELTEEKEVLKGTEENEILSMKPEAKKPKIPKKILENLTRLEQEAKEAEQKLREELQKVGLDPDEFLSPVSKEEITRPEKFIEKIEKEAKDSERKLIEELQKLGLKVEEFFHSPPKTSKGEELSIKGVIESIRKVGVRDLALEKELLTFEEETKKMVEELKKIELEKEKREKLERVHKEKIVGPKEEISIYSREEVIFAYERGQSLAGLDLSGLNLSGLNLRNADFSGSILEGTDLSGSNLAKSDLSETILTGANLSEANLSEVRLLGCDASGADFTEVDLSNADLSDGLFTRAKFHGATLERAILRDADFSESSWKDASLKAVLAEGANFSKSSINRVDFTRASLIYSEFSEASMEGVNFSRVTATNITFDGAKGEGLFFVEADLSQSRADKETKFLHVDFSEANLNGACWEGASLEGANFKGALLDGANFSNANLTRTNFYHASAKEATFTNAIFDKARLSAANFLKAGFEGSRFLETDFKGANLYEAEFWKAILEKVVWDKANLKMTKLHGKVKT